MSQRMHLLGLTLIMRLVLFNSWFAVFGEKAHAMANVSDYLCECMYVTTNNLAGLLKLGVYSEV